LAPVTLLDKRRIETIVPVHEVRFEALNEDRGWYFVEYHPPLKNHRFAIVPDRRPHLRAMYLIPSPAAFSRSICATSSGVCITCLPVVSITGRACTTTSIWNLPPVSGGQFLVSPRGQLTLSPDSTKAVMPSRIRQGRFHRGLGSTRFNIRPWAWVLTPFCQPHTRRCRAPPPRGKPCQPGIIKLLARCERISSGPTAGFANRTEPRGWPSMPYAARFGFSSPTLSQAAGGVSSNPRGDASKINTLFAKVPLLRWPCLTGA
jgi:hypothetical protein